MAATTNIQLVISAKNTASKELQKVHGDLSRVGSSKAFSLLASGAKIAAGAIVAVGTAMGTAAVFAAKSAAEYEQSRIAFDVMLGSADKARKMLKDISDFAVKTPFELPQVVEGAKRLLAYNIEAEKLLPTLSALGDIAAGVGKDKLPNLILAFGQVKAATRLTGMELRQFTEAGVPMLSLLAEQMGKTEAEIKEMVEEGEIGFPAVEKAILSTTQEGGKFFNLMERQSKTFSGMMSNVKDDIGRIGREIMGISEEGDIREGSIFFYLKRGAENLLNYLSSNKEGIMEFFNSVISTTVYWIENWKQLVDWVKSLFAETTFLGQAFLVLKEFFIMFKDIVVNSWNEIKKSIEPIMPELKLLAKFLGGALLVAIMVIVVGFLTLAAGAVKAIESIVRYFSNGIQRIKNTWVAFKEFFLGVMEALRGNWGKAMEYWKTSMSSTVKTLKNMVADFVNFFVRRWNEIIHAANKLPGVDLKEIKEMSKKQYGGPVASGIPYIVGEHRPEIFVPSQSGNIKQVGSKEITVNFNNVSVRNDNDIDSIVRRLKKILNDEQERYQLGAL